MNSVVFHGVPQGHDVFGADDKYFESFYSINDLYRGAKKVFVVEIRKDTIGFCSYYSYIHPQNVVSQSGRSGSYFGMSLKVLGQYCKDVFSLFQLFDKIYSEKIQGTIIKQVGNAEQYAIASFSDASYQLNTISKIADNQIQAYFEHDFEDIDSSFSKQFGSKSDYYNLEEVNSEAFFNSTRIFGKVFISPEYASKNAVIASLTASEKKYKDLIMDYEKQISSLQNDNAQIASLSARVDSLQKDNTLINTQLHDYQTTSKSLKKERDALEQQLKKVQKEMTVLMKSSNIRQVADKLEPNISELLEMLRFFKNNNLIESSSQSSSNLFRKNISIKDNADNQCNNSKKRVMRFLTYVTEIILVLFLMLFLFLFIRTTLRLNREREYNDLLKNQLDNYKKSSVSNVYNLEAVVFEDSLFSGAKFEQRPNTNNQISRS